MPSSSSSADPEPDTRLLIEANPGEEDDARGVFEFHGRIDDAEGKLASAVLVKGHVGQFDEIEVVAIP